MITFESDETSVTVKANNASLGANYKFTFITNDRFYAALLRRDFENQIYNKISAIRREAYEKGWNDHKKRKPKSDWFWGAFKLESER